MICSMIYSSIIDLPGRRQVIYGIVVYFDKRTRLRTNTSYPVVTAEPRIGITES